MTDSTTATRELLVACVEDDPAITRLLDECLAAAGHTGVFAQSGTQAVRRFAGDERIDVLVLDVGLPDMDGRDLCRVLRANGQQAPAMFLSAVGQVHDIVQGFASGGLDYLVKPFAVPELIARIEALGRRSSPSEPVEGLHLDPERFALCPGDDAHLLTPTEFRLVTTAVASASPSDEAVSSSTSSSSTEPGSNSSSSASPTPGASGSTSSGSSSSGVRDGTFTGAPETTRFGTTQVKVTISGGKMSEVTTVQLNQNEPRSYRISVGATPILRTEVLSKQTAAVDNVSGATYTSAAYEASLQLALDEAGYVAPDKSKASTDVSNIQESGDGFGH